MARLRREFGFWSSLGRMRLSDLTAPEVVFGAVIGVALAVSLDLAGKLPERIAVAGDFLAIAGALLGIVFAGFALVITLMTDDYLRWLDETESGIVGFLSPFMVSVGLQVGALLGAVLYRATVSHLPPLAGKWCFGIISVLFFTAALDIVALARSVLMHGVARARGLKISDLQSARERSLQDKSDRKRITGR